MGYARSLKRTLAILLVLLLATPLFGIASFAEGLPGYSQLSTITDTLSEGDYWYNCKGLANLTGNNVYTTNAVFYLSENKQVLRIEYTVNGSQTVEMRYRDTDAQFFKFLMTMPAFGDPLPTSPEGLNDGDYWFDKDGLWAAISPQMDASEKPLYTEASYYLSVDGTILRKTYIFDSGNTSNTDELVLDDPDTMCYFLKQVGADPFEGFTLLPKTEDGLELGDYWFDAALLAKTIGGDIATYYLNTEYYLSEDGNTIRFFLLGKMNTSLKQEGGYFFNYLRQVGIDPNAGFNLLPTSDAGLNEGDYWYDAASLAASSDNDEPLTALYYLSDDGNTLRMIIRGEMKDMQRDSVLAATSFRYLRRVGTDPNLGFNQLPTSDAGLANGTYWYDAAGLEAIFGDRYKGAQYYLSEDGTVLRIVVGGVMTDRTDRSTYASYFSFLRQAGVDPNAGYVLIVYSEEDILCSGYRFRIDDYITNAIGLENEDRANNGNAPYTAQEEQARRAELREYFSTITMYYNSKRFILRIDTEDYSATFRRGDDEFEDYVPYLVYHKSSNHAYNDGILTEATCTEGGFTLFTCTRCGDSYKTNETQALGHNWNNGVVTEPTCTAGGYTTVACARCGESYMKDETAALLGRRRCDDRTDLQSAGREDHYL